MPKSILNPRKRIQLSFTEPSQTKQYFKDECDINNIVSKFTQTGVIPNSQNLDPQYGDAPTTDLKTALDMMNSLRKEFSSLSDQDKAEFDNDPYQYAQFLSDYQEDPESFTQTKSGQTVTTVSETSKNAENGFSESEEQSPPPPA